MTIILLSDGTIINASDVELKNGILRITTTDDIPVEELAALFSDKEKTSHIKLLTESGEESGYKTGFTSFAGIMYAADGAKTVELFQPVDDLERRVANAEGATAMAIDAANAAAVIAAAANDAAGDANKELEEMAQAIEEGVNAV